MQKFKIHSSAVLAAILLLCAVSCQPPIEEHKKPVIKRKYDVRLSNSIGSDWYECDSIIRVSDKRLQLKNKEDSTYYIDITVPQNVVVRVYPK
jgi:hypothetical protein